MKRFFLVLGLLALLLVLSGQTHHQGNGRLAFGRQTATCTGSGDVVCNTIAVPANTLSTTNALHVVWCARRTTGSGQVTWKVKYGGGWLGNSGAISSANPCLEAWMWNDGATNSQRSVQFVNYGAPTVPATNTISIDSTTAQNVTLEVDLATDSDVVTSDWLLVEIIP